MVENEFSLGSDPEVFTTEQRTLREQILDILKRLIRRRETSWESGSIEQLSDLETGFKFDDLELL